MLESENPPTFTKTVSVWSPNIFFLLKGQERVLTKFLVKIKIYQPLLREIQWKVWRHKVRGVFVFFFPFLFTQRSKKKVYPTAKGQRR